MLRAVFQTERAEKESERETVVTKSVRTKWVEEEGTRVKGSKEGKLNPKIYNEKKKGKKQKINMRARF